jgi:hypothetical protein
MASKKPTDFTAEVKEFAVDAEIKAKQAFAKGKASLNDVADFTKGNVAALTQSGKILAAGAKEFGKSTVAEGKTAFATVKADVKELASVKTPTALVGVQSKIVGRNVEKAFAIGAKNSKTLIKLFDQALAPLAARADLAVSKIKKAA